MRSVAFTLLATAVFVKGSSLSNSTGDGQDYDFTCPDDIGYYPYDKTQCRAYYVCYQKEPYLAKCPPGQLFDAHFSECADESMVECGKEVEGLDEEGLECPEKDGLFPHPRDQHLFIQCQGGYPHARTCPDKLLFHTIWKQCAWAKDIPKQTS